MAQPVNVRSFPSLNEAVDPVSKALLGFKQVTRGYALFHLFFSLLACCELFAFVLFFSFLTRSTFFAFSIAAIVLTAFTYFVLLFYFQAKKPYDLMTIHKEFIAKQGSGEPLIEGLETLTSELHRFEYAYYSLPPFLGTLRPLAQKFSVWCHWKDLHEIKEMLLLRLIQEYVSLIKTSPVNPKLHAHLALAYVSLAKLYRDPREIEPLEEHLFISAEYTSETMLSKHKTAATLAIEELKIVDAYEPKNLMVYSLLASLYCDLKRPEEAILAYQSFLEVSPGHIETLFKLGVLYFEQKQPALGLKIYDTLLFLDPEKSEELIAHYTMLTAVPGI